MANSYLKFLFNHVGKKKGLHKRLTFVKLKFGLPVKQKLLENSAIIKCLCASYTLHIDKQVCAQSYLMRMFLWE